MANKYSMEFKKYKNGVRETSVTRTTFGSQIDEALTNLQQWLSANDPDFDQASIFINEKREAIGIWLIVSAVTSETPPIIFSVTISRLPVSQ